MWHLAFQCCGEVLGFGYDCVTQGDGWVGDVPVFVKNDVGYPDRPHVDHPNFPAPVVLE